MAVKSRPLARGAASEQARDRPPSERTMAVGRLYVSAATSVAAMLCLALLGCVAMQWLFRGSTLLRRRASGVLLVLAVVFLWTTSSVVIQLVFEAGRYRKPFFLTYFSTGLLTCYLPFYPGRIVTLCKLCANSFHRGSKLPRRAQYEMVVPTISAGATSSAASTRAMAELGVAVRLSFIFFAYQLCFNVGLDLSSVSTCTVISTSSGLWTLLFSVLRLGERVGPVKLGSTLLTFVGVLIVVAYSGDTARNGAGEDADLLKAAFSSFHRLLGARDHDSSSGGAANGHGAILGNIATLVSAFLYGLYAAQLKLELPSEEEMPLPYLFGLFGAITLVLFAPWIAIAHVLHLERFSPPAQGTLLALVLNALLGSVLANMLLARAMLLASPLVATVGLSLSIPLAMAADALRGRGAFGQAALLGTAAVWAGFTGVSLAEWFEKRFRCRSWAMTRGEEHNLELEAIEDARD